MLAPARPKICCATAARCEVFSTRISASEIFSNCLSGVSFRRSDVFSPSVENASAEAFDPD
ncbi:MAG: hypothetical protein VW257_11450, partial [Quisquiliibacterium sp.]